MKVHDNEFLDFIKIIHKVMFSIVLKIIGWSIDLPVVSQSLSSLVKLDELLKLEVRATISILEPVDALSFDDEAEDHSTELNSEVSCVPISSVHVDTSDESPESCVLEEINHFFVFLAILVELNECRWESDDQTQDQHRELDIPELSSEFNEIVERFVLVSLGDQLCHLNVTLG